MLPYPTVRSLDHPDDELIWRRTRRGHPLDLHSDALKILGTLSEEPIELDTPLQVLTAIALAQSGRFDEAIETAKYFVLVPEVTGPLGEQRHTVIVLNARSNHVIGNQLLITYLWDNLFMAIEIRSRFHCHQLKEKLVRWQLTKNCRTK